jgi:hypothetical protein
MHVSFTTQNKVFSRYIYQISNVTFKLQPAARVSRYVGFSYMRQYCLMSPWSEKSFWILDFYVTKYIVTVPQFQRTNGGFHQVKHRFFYWDSCLNASHPPRETTKHHIHNFFFLKVLTDSVLVVTGRRQNIKIQNTEFCEGRSYYSPANCGRIFKSDLTLPDQLAVFTLNIVGYS